MINKLKQIVKDNPYTFIGINEPRQIHYELATELATKNNLKGKTKELLADLWLKRGSGEAISTDIMYISILLLDKYYDK